MTDIISVLKSDMNKYNRIILIDFKIINVTRLLANEQHRNIMFYIPSYILSPINGKYIRIISEKEKYELINLYHLYEFSDKFRVLSENENYGGVTNLFNTCILTEDEMYESLFVL